MNTEQKIWKGAGVLKKALLPLFLYLLIPACLSAAGKALRHFEGSTESFLAESGNFYQLLGTAFCLFLFRLRAKKRGSTLREETTLFTENIDRKLAALYLLLGFFSALAVSAVLTVTPLPAFLGQSYEESASAVFQRTDLGLVVFNLVILSPVVEEIIFRGYMLSRLLTFFSERTAVALTAGIFGLCHVDLIWILYASVLGVILAWTAIRKDNILYGIILHGGFNLFSAVNLILVKSGLSEQVFLANRFAVVLYGLIGCFSVLLIRRELVSREEWYL